MNAKILTKLALVGALIVTVAYWLRGYDLLTGLGLVLLFLFVVAKVVGAVIARRGGSSASGASSGLAGQPLPRPPVGQPPALTEANEVRH
jgi:hypothetical protein